MKLLPRRKFLHLAAGAAVVPAVTRRAAAQTYPARPVRLVVGYPAGAAPDIMARLTGQWLSDRLNQQFVVDNRPGAASNIGTEIVAKAPPDGYTLLMTVSSNTVNATLYPNLNFNFKRDLAPVGSVGATPFVLIAAPSFPPKTIPELIAYAKANPGKVNMATQGVGTSPHVVGELLKMMTGINMVHVPYRGNYMSDLMSGQVQVSFTPIAQALEFARDGRVRALAVTTVKRSDALPDVPTIGEFVPGFAANGWYGVCAPAGTPSEIVERLNQALSGGVADANFKARLLALGLEPIAMTPAAFSKFVADEIEKWAKVINFAGIKPE